MSGQKLHDIIPIHFLQHLIVLLGFFPLLYWGSDCGGKTININDCVQAKKLSLLEDSLHLKANGLWLFPAPS